MSTTISPINSDNHDNYNSLPSLPYPAITKSATSLISSTSTTATLTSFSDKLLLTISQHGKLAQWFSVPLGSDNPSIGDGGYLSLNGLGGGGAGYENDIDGNEDDELGGGLLIPQNRFVARTLLGGGGTEREVFGGFLSRCIAGLVVGRQQQQGMEVGRMEDRVLIVGLGLVGVRVENAVGGQEGDGADGDSERRETVLRVLELVSRVL